MGRATFGRLELPPGEGRFVEPSTEGTLHSSQSTVESQAGSQSTVTMYMYPGPTATTRASVRYLYVCVN